jgi:hemerythrin-like metal-binding protein
MNKIEWSENFSVGVAEIDNQHRQLIGLINDLVEAKNQNKSMDELSTMISKMADYLDYHFGTEEKYMLRFQYAGLESHRNEHRTFIRKVFEFRKQYSLDSQSLTQDLLAFLMGWLRHHILETDMSYSQCFRENGLV